ncbi:zincin [Neocallimastix californiae]|uniref:Zincin n=1 Tax=Neocallimastix californiae TaxID=1754190 RepID=A0A1Y1ZBK5_9FUNG|nr:zincin [Neocallimastix californiae]|eukprot:ORY07566.1 zincin [Neocallimastix californiae]
MNILLILFTLAILISLSATKNNTEYDIIELIDWSVYNKEGIKEKANDYILFESKIIDEIENIPDEKCSFDSVIVPIGRYIQDKINSIKLIIDFLKYVPTDNDIREVATEALFEIEKFENDNYKNNKIIFHKISKVLENIKTGLFDEPEDHEDKALLNKIFKDFKKRGLGLSKEDSDELNNLKKRLSDLTNDFNQCLNEDITSFTFTEKELKGVPKNILQYYEKIKKNGEVAYNIDFDELGYKVIMEQARNENTRKVTREIVDQRCKSNVDILKEIAIIKLKIANLYGYKSHSQFRLENNMAKTPETVFNFLNKLKEKIQPKAKEEIQKLLEYKKIEKAALNETYDGTFNLWDFEYYRKQLLRKEYPLNKNINVYYPVNEVIKEIHNIYEKLLSIKIKEIKNPNVWSSDVRQFIVSDEITKDIIGTFYTDIFYKQGKYDFTSSYILEYGYKDENGNRVHPCGVIVSNFDKPTSENPALLSHEDIIDYFHELGHIFHLLLSENKWSKFNGWLSEDDFTETPSQLLEYWAWEPQVLVKISHHYKNHEEKIPLDVAMKMAEIKNCDIGINILYQIFYSLVDLKLFSIEKEDEDFNPNEIWNSLTKEVLMVDTNFDHIVNEYDSIYYSYLWGQVYSADMFYSQFKKHGIFNTKIGRKYRNILKKGSSYKAMDLLEEFLNRYPNDNAFIENLDLSSSD